jgi:hypothetical protein
MGRTTKPPKGYLTSAQAVKRSRLPRSSFYELVKKGKIAALTPPNKKDSFYLEKDVDRVRIEQEAFLLQYASDTSEFGIATEDDILGIADLNADLFGGTRETRYELRLKQYHANSEVFHVLRQDGIVVGYLGIFPLELGAIKKILSGMPESRFRIEVLSPEHITAFEPGKTENVFLIIGVKQNVPKSKLYGARIIAGGIQFLEELARRGVILKKAYGTSRTPDGIKIAKSLGFKQMPVIQEPDEGLLRFELDLETTSHPLLRSYQEIRKIMAPDQ